MTAVIHDISPSIGSTSGGDTIIIEGSNFGTSPSVEIDGISCSIVSSSSTQINCVTGMRVEIPSFNSFSVSFAEMNAHISCDPFLYVDRWSSVKTWGGEAPPREGENVYVPKGMVLLVDESTPVLNSIIVEGKIFFADEKDMTVDAHYFMINGGEFRAGTEENPYQHQLIFTLHGGYYDKQLPIFGNKVLGCENCKFNMHGRVRTPTWTEVADTIQPGAT